jgi:hypothetical protein
VYLGDGVDRGLARRLAVQRVGKQRAEETDQEYERRLDDATPSSSAGRSAP